MDYLKKGTRVKILNPINLAGYARNLYEEGLAYVAEIEKVDDKDDTYPYLVNFIVPDREFSKQFWFREVNIARLDPSAADFSDSTKVSNSVVEKAKCDAIVRMRTLKREIDMRKLEITELTELQARDKKKVKEYQTLINKLKD